LKQRQRSHCSSPPQERKGYVRIPRPLTPSAHHRHARFERARNAAHGAGSPVTRAPDASGLARSPVPRRCRAARHRVVPRRDRARGPAWASRDPVPLGLRLPHRPPSKRASVFVDRVAVSRAPGIRRTCGRRSLLASSPLGGPRAPKFKANRSRPPEDQQKARASYRARRSELADDSLELRAVEARPRSPGSAGQKSIALAESSGTANL
jgi:hypothetical protein